MTRSRGTLLAAAVAVAMVLAPFLFWRGTWFGRPLSDAQIEQQLHDDSKPRSIQHALVQISQRLDRRGTSIERWYPRVAALALHPVTELRVTAAWVMGQDNGSELFHRTLAAMLKDVEPAVRRNAALSLARLGDAAGRPELQAMLRPFALRAPRQGALRYRLRTGDSVNPGTLVARLQTADPEPLEIRSPLPGKIERKLAEEGARVEAGQELLWVSPSPEHVWESLRALYLVGSADDLPDVERFRNPPADWSSKIGEQAKRTVQSIRGRR